VCIVTTASATKAIFSRSCLVAPSVSVSKQIIRECYDFVVAGYRALARLIGASGIQWTMDAATFEVAWQHYRVKPAARLTRKRRVHRNGQQSQTMPLTSGLPRYGGRWVNMNSLLRPVFSVEQAPALRIQVTETIGLQPIRQNPEQKVTWKVRGRWTAENIVPLGTKRFDVDVFPIRQRRANPHPGHGG
jgi:hypothetical protein